MLNTVILVGTVTKIIPNKTKSGIPMCRFTMTLAGKNETIVPCVCFGDTAEQMRQVTEGETVAISGRLTSRELDGRSELSVTAGYIARLDSGSPFDD